MTETLEALRGAELDCKARLRIAALLAYVHVRDANDDALRLMENEAWLLQHGMDPQDFPNDTAHSVPTRDLVDELLEDDATRAENAALLLCTFREL